MSRDWCAHTSAALIKQILRRYSGKCWALAPSSPSKYGGKSSYSCLIYRDVSLRRNYASHKCYPPHGGDRRAAPRRRFSACRLWWLVNWSTYADQGARRRYQPRWRHDGTDVADNY